MYPGLSLDKLELHTNWTLLLSRRLLYDLLNEMHKDYKQSIYSERLLLSNTPVAYSKKLLGHFMSLKLETGESKYIKKPA